MSMDHFYRNKHFLLKFSQQPLSQHIKLYAEYLLGLGFSWNTGRNKLARVIRFSKWLENQELTTAEVDAELLNRYMLVKIKGRKNTPEDEVAVRQFVQFLRERGLVKTELHLLGGNCASDEVNNEFAQFLRDHRGLASKSIAEYCLHVNRFLKSYFSFYENLSTLDGRQLTEYVMTQAAKTNPKAASRLISALRAFCKFLCFHGYKQTDLSKAIPSAANWSVTEFPVALGRNEVKLLISSCDKNSSLGLRDYAILLVLARLGLRAREVCSIKLDDIDWTSGTIIVHGKGRKTSIMPLPSDVGKALAEYLRKSRPKARTRFLFLRSTAPISGLSVQSICGVVNRALSRAKIESPRRGAHLLRHSLATGMLRDGATLAEIAEVLRHENVRSTTVYAKVDFENLRTLALPWPGETQ